MDLLFEQVAMVEGVQCWHDREEYSYTQVHSSLLPLVIVWRCVNIAIGAHTGASYADPRHAIARKS